MRPLSIEEVSAVYGGTHWDQQVYDWQVQTFLWQLGLVGNQGSSSEQPVPPEWWNDCSSPQYQSYLANTGGAGGGTLCP